MKHVQVPKVAPEATPVPQTDAKVQEALTTSPAESASAMLAPAIDIPQPAQPSGKLAWLVTPLCRPANRSVHKHVPMHISWQGEGS